MGTVTVLRPIGIDEYLEGEQISELRHELVNGEVWARVEASNVHNLIAGNLYIRLRAHLKNSCQAYMSDMKVRVDDNFYYPDLVVNCQPLVTPFYYLNTPILIIDVLSPSTKIRDRLEKRIAYQRLESLKEYTLISQEKALIEVYRRLGSHWELETFGVNDTVHLRSIGFEVAIAELYTDAVSFR